MSDEFYIGYEPQMPTQMATWIRRVACGLVALALVLPAVLVFSADRFASGVFEYGRPQTFVGRIVEWPYPALVVDHGGVRRMYWLVGPGKHGAGELVRGRDGVQARLAGSLITRDDDAMIEVLPDRVEIIQGSAIAAEPLRSGGVVVAEGEIVDAKCHLGVMKPGEGPLHRDCAVRCLLGRIPPMFVAHDSAGLGRLSLITNAAKPFVEVDRFAGRRVRVRGEILERDAQRFLALSPDDIHVLD